MGIEQLMRDNPLGLDDEFDFHCNGCSDCCEEVDGLLSPLDILRACAHLEMEPEEFTEEYCDFYIGDNTKLPLFRLWCEPDSGRCMLYDGEEGCTIHPVKPPACALYPLARGQGEDGALVYVHTGNVCGNSGHRQTVREWLEQNNLVDSERFSASWRNWAGEVAGLLRRFWERESSNALMGEVYHRAGKLLYFDYDVGGEPLAQIARNVEALKVYLAEMLEAG